MSPETDAENPYTSRPWQTAYAEGVPQEIGEVTETLPEMLAESIRRHARRDALDFAGRRWTYQELGEQVERAAEGLRRRGVGPGDRVALVLPNCPQHVVAFYAILRLGAIVVEHNPLYTARELRHQFEDHGAAVAVVWDKIAPSLDDFPGDIRVRHLITVDLRAALPWTKRLALRLPVPSARKVRQALTATERVRGATPWEDLTSGRRLRRSHPGPSLDDVAALQYTSGTTGSPKGAVLTHRNLRANAMQGRAWVPGLTEGGEVFWGVLPLFHAYGLTLCLTFALSIGATLVLFPRFDADQALASARRTPPTFLPAVPPIYDALVRESQKKRVSLSSVRFAISGAMSLPVETVRRWEEATGGLLVEGYGMTEASPVIAGNPIGPTRRPGTVGVPFPGTEIRVVDPDAPGTLRPLGEAGELLVRGPQVFQGYWQRPDETRETLLSGGWLRTGDIVTMAPDGFLTVIDRIKELVITGGFNVAPSEVEDVLLRHPDIGEAAVVGMPGSNGEEVHAAVVLRAGAALDPDSIRGFAREHLAGYKVPRQVHAVDELPRSLIGKVLRRQVRDRLLAEQGTTAPDHDSGHRAGQGSREVGR